jgi:DNA-binding NarL/FixJ family response regulator
LLLRQQQDQQRLITLLLSGLTDEAIARQLGTSHRTIQRRVAALMSELGAHTRFQVGVQAALNRRRAT